MANNPVRRSPFYISAILATQRKSITSLRGPKCIENDGDSPSSLSFSHYFCVCLIPTVENSDVIRHSDWVSYIISVLYLKI